MDWNWLWPTYVIFIKYGIVLSISIWTRTVTSIILRFEWKNFDCLSKFVFFVKPINSYCNIWVLLLKFYLKICIKFKYWLVYYVNDSLRYEHNFVIKSRATSLQIFLLGLDVNAFNISRLGGSDMYITLRWMGEPLILSII